jgi:hypothetical protein
MNYTGEIAGLSHCGLLDGHCHELSGCFAAHWLGVSQPDQFGVSRFVFYVAYSKIFLNQWLAARCSA